MPAPINPHKKALFIKLLQEGFTVRQAAERAGVSYSWARKYMGNMPVDHRDLLRQHRAEQEMPGPIPYLQLSKEAKRAWDDFEYFRLRYFGHLSTPWQVETAETVVAALATDEQEYIVENVAPGSGKSTLLTDIACWVTVRDRRIRGLFGSAASYNASRQLSRVKRSLERTTPERANPRHKQLGMAVDAEAVLSKDFGLFKPVSRDMWTRGEFIVAQHDDHGAISEKEPTWSSFGFDARYLGNRFDVIFWDDVTTKKDTRSLDLMEQMREDWDAEAESRLEPGGLFMLVGQRLGADDIYRYCLDKTILDTDDDDDEPEQDDSGEQRPGRPMYRHIAYRAHDETKCQGRVTHRRDSPPWPDGCLLDPKRLSWPFLRQKMLSRDFATVYQQEDGDPADRWVPDIWVHGGVDKDTKEQHPGCLDVDRRVGEIPKHLHGPIFSIATVDPSPERRWSVIWWLYEHDTGLAYLIDSFNSRLRSDEFLTPTPDGTGFTGLAADWQARSQAAGYPIKHWVFEINAAQRWAMQHRFVTDFATRHHTTFVRHSTGVNKLDPQMGVDALRDWFKYGRIRVPYGNSPDRGAALRYIGEIKKYPGGGYDDQVMSTWFLVYNVPKLARPHEPAVPQKRPSWAGTIPDVRKLTVVR